MVTTMVYNIPLETRLYPRIMARGIHTGRLIFYEGNRRLTLNQGVQIPKISGQPDEKFLPIWKFLTNFQRFLTPPFDKDKEDYEINIPDYHENRGPTRAIRSTTTLQQSDEIKSQFDNITLTELAKRLFLKDLGNRQRRDLDNEDIPWECSTEPYREWFEHEGGICGMGNWEMPRENARNQSIQGRIKRELPWDCSWPPTRLVFEWGGGVCAEGISKEMKNILTMVTKQQEKDRHAIHGIRQLTDILMSQDHDLANELTTVEQALAAGLKDADDNNRALATILLKTLSELAFSNILNTYTNMWRVSRHGAMSLGDVPAPMREKILATAATSNEYLTTEMLEQNRKILLEPVVAFRNTKENIGVSLTTHLPEIKRECKIFQIQPIGLEVEGQCMSGPDMFGTAVLECDDDHWLVTNDCLNACHKSSRQEYFCHVNECSKTGYIPNWINNNSFNGPLLAPKISDETICLRQPSLIFVGNNRYMLTRHEDVMIITDSPTFNGIKTIETKIHGIPGMLFNASCKGDIRIKLNNETYIGRDCDFGTTLTSNIGTIQLENESIRYNDQITNSPGNWKQIIDRLKKQTLLERLNQTAQAYHIIGIKVKANLKDASETQLALATHIRNLQTTDYTSVRLMERVAIAIALILAIFSTIAVCAMGKINFPSLRSTPIFRINRIQLQDIPSSEPTATAPMIQAPPKYEQESNQTHTTRHISISNPWSELTPDESRMLRDLMATSNFGNLSEIEVATFIANTYRPDGDRNKDPVARSLLGMA